MFKNVALAATAAVVLGLTGCAPRYAVKIASDPPGAEVSCNGQSYGYTPVTRYFKLNDANKKSGYLRTCHWKLQWVSGATSYAGNIYNIRMFPDGVTLRISRPDTPNAYIDHFFAQKLRQNAKMSDVLRQLHDIKSEQQRVKQQKQSNDRTQRYCNMGLLDSPACK